MPSEPKPSKQTEARPYTPGELISPKYRLVRRLGEGGFGEVWVAEDLVLDVRVALKLLYGELALRGGGARLLQEARAAAKLGHPAIVRVFEFGESNRGQPFIAMELLHGETLADIIAAKSRLPAGQALQTLLPIADALAVAHGKGIVHRDVKPENIFLSRDDLGRLSPKLLDFGIARLDVNQHLTTGGAVLGTPAYMCPEQARGNSHVDERADIWGFSTVLYELLTGKPPFEAENYNALLQSIINDEPPAITELRAGDEDLWLLIRMGLDKDPGRRWESMRMYGEALALWLFERGIREDICGSSLRTSWLEAEFSDVKIMVGSVPPEGLRNTPTEPPSHPDPEPQPPPPAVTAPEPEREAPAPSSSKRLLIAGAVVLFALIGLVALLLATRKSPEGADIEALGESSPVPSSAAAASTAPPPTVAPVPIAPSSAPRADTTAPAPKRPKGWFVVPGASSPGSRPPAPAGATKPKVDLGF